MKGNDTTHPLFQYKYKGEIAQDLGISLSTLKRWLIKYDIKIPRGYVSPEHQMMIYDKFQVDWQKEGTQT